MRYREDLPTWIELIHDLKAFGVELRLVESRSGPFPRLVRVAPSGMTYTTAIYFEDGNRQVGHAVIERIVRRLHIDPDEWDRA